MQTKHLLLLAVLPLLAGCTFIENDEILAPQAADAWHRVVPPRYTGWMPYVDYKDQGVTIESHPALLHSRTWVGPGYFPVIPVTETRDGLRIMFDFASDALFKVDPRQIALAAPCGPDAPQSESGIRFTRVNKLIDLRDRGKVTDAPTEDAPVWVMPGFHLIVALVIAGPPEKYQFCTATFGNVIADPPANPPPPLTFKRDRFRSLDWD